MANLNIDVFFDPVNAWKNLDHSDFRRIGRMALHFTPDLEAMALGEIILDAFPAFSEIQKKYT